MIRFLWIFMMTSRCEMRLKKAMRTRLGFLKCLRTSLSEYSVGKFTDDIPLYAIGGVINDYLSGRICG